VASQVNGTWHTALQVPGTAVTRQIGHAQVLSVSCASARNCTAGGDYGYWKDSVWHGHAFVASEVKGAWHTAVRCPGSLPSARAWTRRSCASAGNCSAGGFYRDDLGHWQAFVVSQVNGTWRPATEVPGTATLNKSWQAQVNSVSCGAAGNCSAGGFYTNGSKHRQAFVDSES
jgi:hypothetical protein